MIILSTHAPHQTRCVADTVASTPTHGLDLIIREAAAAAADARHAVSGRLTLQNTASMHRTGVRGVQHCRGASMSISMCPES